jgi:predicted nucleic acid-binding protein
MIDKTGQIVVPNKCFLDSNIWLYAFNAPQDSHKHTIANRLLQAKGFIVSTQVINEVCRNLIKKASFSDAQITSVINAFYKRCDVVCFDKSILLAAANVRDHYRISFWDSLIVSSALSAKAEFLYSEDMQDGLLIEEKLTIISPF